MSSSEAKDDLCLLPMPRHLRKLDGVHEVQAGKLVRLRAAQPGALRHVGEVVAAAVNGKWELTAAGEAPQEVAMIVAVDPAQVPRPEGYSLQIHADQIRLVGHDLAGTFYGAMTFRQIVRQAAGDALPCVRIDDWPTFAHRGVMLDVSRSRVFTMDTLRMLVSMFAEMKFNQLQLYTEHTFAYRHHREVWEEASPMTGEQVMELDALCRAHHMELVPNQNSFGHFGKWLMHEPYHHLSEMPVKRDADGEISTGGCLCPGEPDSIKLLDELYDELLPHFSSAQFNVGCDETFTLGKGRSAERAEREGVGRVYLDFLLKIHQLVRKHGARCSSGATSF